MQLSLHLPLIFFSFKSIIIQSMVFASVLYPVCHMYLFAPPILPNLYNRPFISPFLLYVSSIILSLFQISLTVVMVDFTWCLISHSITTPLRYRVYFFLACNPISDFISSGIPLSCPYIIFLLPFIFPGYSYTHLHMLALLCI